MIWWPSGLGWWTWIRNEAPKQETVGSIPAAGSGAWEGFSLALSEWGRLLSCASRVRCLSRPVRHVYSCVPFIESLYRQVEALKNEVSNVKCEKLDLARQNVVRVLCIFLRYLYSILSRLICAMVQSPWKKSRYMVNFGLVRRYSCPSVSNVIQTDMKEIS